LPLWVFTHVSLILWLKVLRHVFYIHESKWMSSDYSGNLYMIFVTHKYLHYIYTAFSRSSTGPNRAPISWDNISQPWFHWTWLGVPRDFVKYKKNRHFEKPPENSEYPSKYRGGFCRQLAVMEQSPLSKISGKLDNKKNTGKNVSIFFL
jgi:hypothetical protein